uniref:Uncharacterized protein n=1 Tax=Globodera rostochiensis TaxID=31243 RepID=A0A914H8H1_GLORO
MTAALLLQCARPLLVVVAALLLCCCRPVEAQEEPWDFNRFSCARTGVQINSREFPKDNQTRINSWQLDGDTTAILGLLMNTKDKKLKLTMVGAGASCSNIFSRAKVDGQKCVLGKATKVGLKHQPEEPCKDAGVCKAFTLTCPFKDDDFVHLPADTHVVKVEMNFFRALVDRRCKWRAYIDDARQLVFGRKPYGEKCPEKMTDDPKKTTTGSTGTTTTQKAIETTTGGSTEATTTSNANTTATNSTDAMTTESTDTMGSTDANITSGWTLIIVVSVVGAIMFSSVASAVVLVLWRRKQRTSADGTEEDEKASSPKAESSAKSSKKGQTPEDASEAEGEDEASSANTPKKTPSSAVDGVEVPSSLYSKASPDDEDEGASVV